MVIRGVLGHRSRRSFGLRHGHEKVVVLRFRIRQLADRLDELPVAAIERILRALDRRKRISGAEADSYLRADLLSDLLVILPVNDMTVAVRFSITGAVVSTSKRALTRSA